MWRTYRGYYCGYVTAILEMRRQAAEDHHRCYPHRHLVSACSRVLLSCASLFHFQGKDGNASSPCHWSSCLASNTMHKACTPLWHARRIPLMRHQQWASVLWAMAAPVVVARLGFVNRPGHQAGPPPSGSLEQQREFSFFRFLSSPSGQRWQCLQSLPLEQPWVL